jgi:hypothetical protein
VTFGKFAISANHPAHLVLGLVIWSVWFIAMYGGLSVYCSVTDHHQLTGIFNPLNVGLLIFTVITCVKLAVLALWCWRSARGFPGRVSAMLYIAAFIATIAVAAPVLYLPPCL